MSTTDRNQAILHVTPRGWWVAVLTGMPTDPVYVGQGQTEDDARADLSPTAIQSCGKDCGEADALEWASQQPGSSFYFGWDANGWSIYDREV